MSSEPKLETFISRIKKADLKLEELYNNPDNDMYPVFWTPLKI